MQIWAQQWSPELWWCQLKSDYTDKLSILAQNIRPFPSILNTSSSKFSMIPEQRLICRTLQLKELINSIQDYLSPQLARTTIKPNIICSLSAENLEPELHLKSDVCDSSPFQCHCSLSSLRVLGGQEASHRHSRSSRGLWGHKSKLTTAVSDSQVITDRLSSPWETQTGHLLLNSCL